MVHRPFDHAFGGENLRLPDRGGGLDVDDERVVDIDQIIGRIGEEGLPAMRRGPARGRVGWRDELGRHVGHGAKAGAPPGLVAMGCSSAGLAKSVR